LIGDLIMPKAISISTIAVLLGAAALAAPASAAQLVPQRQTCTTLNCNALELPGQINSHLGNLANPWVAQFAGQANSCLRFHVTAQSRDLAMSVVAPDGTVFTNNAGGAPCPACPRVVITAVSTGFYTVVINTTTGAPAEGTFTLRAGAYNNNNATNCANPTVGR